MKDYTIFYKESFDTQSTINIPVTWDILISTYLLDERVKKVFDVIHSKQKYWLVHDVYDFQKDECPSPKTGVEIFNTLRNDEAESAFISRFIKSLNVQWSKASLCVDITGFIGPTLIFLLLYLKSLGVRKFDAIYSEPDYYSNREETPFSDKNVVEIRQVDGYEGKHVVDNSKDILIIGMGYDYSLINQIAEFKKFSQKIKVFGFPSLKADMYQESILQFYGASEAIGIDISYPDGYYAPANDPFVTASIMSKIINDLKKGKGFNNIYLCPMGTKPQILGFSLFYLSECRGGPVSMIYPYCLKYNKNNSIGLTKIWKYTVEFC